MRDQLHTFKASCDPNKFCQVERLINRYVIRVLGEGHCKAMYLKEEEAERMADFILERRVAKSTPKLILAVGDVAYQRSFQPVINEEYATQRAMQLVEDNPSSPIWLAQIIKQYLPTTPVYEWKSI